MEQYNSYGHAFIFNGTTITPPSLSKEEEDGDDSYTYNNTGHDSDDDEDEDYCPSNIRDVEENENENEEEYSREYQERSRRLYGSTNETAGYNVSKYYTTFGPDDVDPSGDDFNPFGFVNNPTEENTMGFNSSESVEFASFTDFGEVNLTFPNVNEDISASSSSNNGNTNNDPFGSSSNFDFGFETTTTDTNTTSSTSNDSNAFDPFSNNNKSTDHNNASKDPFATNTSADPFADFPTTNNNSDDLFR